MIQLIQNRPATKSSSAQIYGHEKSEQRQIVMDHRWRHEENTVNGVLASEFTNHPMTLTMKMMERLKN